MSHGRATRGRRDGTAYQDRREIRERQKENRQSCAIMQDGSIVPVMSLAHQVELASKGEVKRFAWADEIPPEMFYNPDADADIWDRITGVAS